MSGGGGYRVEPGKMEEGQRSPPTVLGGVCTRTCPQEGHCMGGGRNCGQSSRYVWCGHRSVYLGCLVCLGQGVWARTDFSAR